MGRVAYKVKNTFVEFGAPGDHQDFECLDQHAWSSDLVAQDLQEAQTTLSDVEAAALSNLAAPAERGEAQEFMPATPSPLMHPSMLMPSEMMPPFDIHTSLPPAAFDTAAEGFQCLPHMDSQDPGFECLPHVDSQEPGFECLPHMESQEQGFEDMQEMCIPAMAYDPNSGWCSGWCMPLSSAAAYTSMGCQEMGDMSQWEYMGQDGMEGVQDIGEFQEFQEPPEGAEMPQELQHELQHELQQEALPEELQPELLQQLEQGGLYQGVLDGRGRDLEGSQGSDERPDEELSMRSGNARSWGKHYVAKPGCCTTVMLRNVPNKYTREMLVEQLNRDFRGRFDFVYLPIDFKNGCNVGYGFINFRTVEACSEFVSAFDGVDVCRCLPGLHSRKVAEVTPARVQGLEENVRRLRGSPVMGELSRHPEWMPLLLGEDGEELPFPNPEQPVPPVRPRSRRGREAWASSDRSERVADRTDAGGRGRSSWRR